MLSDPSSAMKVIWQDSVEKSSIALQLSGAKCLSYKENHLGGSFDLR